MGGQFEQWPRTGSPLRRLVLVTTSTRFTASRPLKARSYPPGIKRCCVHGTRSSKREGDDAPGDRTGSPCYCFGLRPAKAISPAIAQTTKNITIVAIWIGSRSIGSEWYAHDVSGVWP